jgi:hypothetical protein
MNTFPEIERLIYYWRILASALKSAGVADPSPSGLLRAADDLERAVKRAKGGDNGHEL